MEDPVTRNLCDERHKQIAECLDRHSDCLSEIKDGLHALALTVATLPADVLNRLEPRIKEVVRLSLLDQPPSPSTQRPPHEIAADTLSVIVRTPKDKLLKVLPWLLAALGLGASISRLLPLP